MNGTFVLSQRELPLKSIKPNQAIAVVFTRIASQPVLLNGVVKPLRRETLPEQDSREEKGWQEKSVGPPVKPLCYAPPKKARNKAAPGTSSGGDRRSEHH